MSETWFILRDGGVFAARDHPKYIGRTTDIKAAIDHFRKCKKNPYSNGDVTAFTDKKQITIIKEDDFFTEI